MLNCTKIENNQCNTILLDLINEDISLAEF